MPIRLRREEGDLFRVDIRGTLRSGEFEQCQRELAAEMSRTPSVRLLVVLDTFEGWDPRDDWRDLSFYMKHGDAIERIAIVGPEAWRSSMLLFAATDLRKAPVEFFAENRLARASAWLSAGVSSTEDRES